MSSANGSGLGTTIPAWTEAYTYDGFGNLLDKTSTGGAPTLQQAVNANSNQIVGQGYDANGNDLSYGSYDYENRLAGSGGDAFSYGPDNLRTYKYESNGTEYVYFYDPFGHRMGAYETSNTSWVQNDVYCACGEATASWFGGINLAGTDRLGSAESGYGYYPYGEEYTPPSGDGDDFATYYHDADTSLDYARNRYYNSILGRFLSADPSTAKAFADPGQWNKYAYAGNDPVNFYDPLGLQQLAPENNPLSGDYRSDGGGGGACGTLMNVPPDPESGSSGGVDCILNNPSGSSPAGGPVTGAPDLQELLDAINEADNLLLKKDCAAFLGAGVADPYLILQGLGVSQNGQFGSISFGPLPSSVGTTTFATTSIASSSFVAIGNGATQLQAQTVSITLNSLPGGFLSESLYAQGVTLLHELGHTIYDLFGPSGTGQLGSSYPIQPDFNNTKASMANTNAIQKHCH